MAQCCGSKNGNGMPICNSLFHDSLAGFFDVINLGHHFWQILAAGFY
jgi:hypothetical protein